MRKQRARTPLGYVNGRPVHAGQPVLSSASWSELDKLLDSRRPRMPPSRKQAHRLMEALTREGGSDNLTSHSWAPELIWSSAAAERAIETIAARYEAAISRDKSSAAVPSRKSQQQQPELVADNELGETMEAQEPFPMPSQPQKKPETSARSRPKPGRSIIYRAVDEIKQLLPPSPVRLHEPEPFEEFAPLSPVAAEAKAALDAMTRIGDRPFDPPPRVRRPSSASSPSSARTRAKATKALRPSSAGAVSVKKPSSRPHSAQGTPTNMTTTASNSSSPRRSPKGSPVDRSVVPLFEILRKIHERTEAMKNAEGLLIDEGLAGETDDELGLATVPLGVASLLGITGMQLKPGAIKTKLDLDGIITKLYRPPPLLHLNHHRGSEQEEPKRGPKKEYQFDCGVPVRDKYDWSQSDLLICAIDGDCDSIPLELTLLFQNVGEQENGGVDRVKWIKGMNILLHLHNELRCPKHVHEAFWSAHAYKRPGAFVSTIMRISAMSTARNTAMALLRALIGRASDADKALAKQEMEDQEKELAAANAVAVASAAAGAGQTVSLSSPRLLSSRSSGVGQLSPSPPHSPLSTSASNEISAAHPLSGLSQGSSSRPQSRARSAQSQRSSVLSSPSSAAGSRASLTKEATTAASGDEQEDDEQDEEKTAKEPARPKEPFSLGQAARLIRLGAQRAVKFAQRRNVGEDEAKERTPRRKDEIAALLQSLSLDGAARAGLIGEEDEEDDAVTANTTHTTMTTSAPPAAAASSAASSAALVSKYRKASTLTSLSLSLSRDGDGGGGGGEAAAERAALVQALVDRYCRVLPWPLEVFVFGGVAHRPSSHLFLCVR